MKQQVYIKSVALEIVERSKSCPGGERLSESDVALSSTPAGPLQHQLVVQRLQYGRDHGLTCDWEAFGVLLVGGEALLASRNTTYAFRA